MAMPRDAREGRKMQEPEADRYLVGPVMKALKVLDAIAEKGHPVSLTRIATELELPKTSAFRYLRTLSAAGFLTYDEQSDRYSVGIRFRALATADKQIQRLKELALPVLGELSREFNETVNLGVLTGNEVVYIDMIESSRALRMQARIGSRDPLHSTALGKAMLAQLPVLEQTRLLSAALSQRTLRTITQKRTIERQLRQIEKSGVAIEVGENEEGTMCIGVAIVSDHPMAAISISAPERRMTAAIQAQSILSLKRAAQTVSSGLMHSSAVSPDLLPAGAH
jgi:IclR family KDG regulon transcriptional repressor